ncbi:fungal transcriptional regulatory protein [Scheffersomyces coipomensis]|uniref:fungal transcriptional regulatory protein n=1 Tax=Scheffersomyces coipomensis TaxID=1788519 RepID=UPI00315D0533
MQNIVKNELDENSKYRQQGQPQQLQQLQQNQQTQLTTPPQQSTTSSTSSLPQQQGTPQQQQQQQQQQPSQPQISSQPVPPQQQQQQQYNPYYQNYYQPQPPLPASQPSYYNPVHPPPPPGVQQQTQPQTASGSLAPPRSAAAFPRKRALTACDTCRLKKIKCDNVRPRCGSCVKNGNLNCHYRTDDQQKDVSTFDPASINIIGKLDVILRDLKDIKKHSGITESSSQDDPILGDGKIRPQRASDFKFDDCFWDMSLTSILKWNSFRQYTGETSEEIGLVINQLVKDYNTDDVGPFRKATLFERLELAKNLEVLIRENLSAIINSFFVNCYTKTPILDTLEIFESLEIFKCLMSYDPSITLVKLLEDYEPNTPSDQIPEFVIDALKAANLEDTPYRRLAYKTLCESIPLFLTICALGIISTSIQLENLSKFNSSTEEKESTILGSLSSESTFNKVPLTLPRDRSQIAFLLINYAQFLDSAFPDSIKQSSLVAVEFNLLLSQYYLYIMCPVKAYRFISIACHNMMYFLTMRNINNTYSSPSLDSNKREMIDRLFWTCLKLECELRVELSPYVPLSGITQVIPPTSFPKIPDPMTLEIREAHSEACLKLANKHDDEKTWYYFLTEIAVRKVDNKMFDEIYSFENTLKKTWDQEAFSNESVWILFIKYLNQYNGIINSLNPQIRTFVLQEVNVDQIHRRMKKKYEKKHARVAIETDIFDSLDDFLIDDDLLLRAQSESIMFIKTRIISSKLLLFRPLVYLLLEDKIPFVELLEAAMAVVSTLNANSSLNTLNSVESPDSMGSNSNPLTGTSDPSDIDMELDYFNLVNAPLFYQKQHPDEDFSNIIEYIPVKNSSSDENNPNNNGNNTDTEESPEDSFRLKSLPLARSRILRIFIQNLISIPKLNIPKLGSHRHPGSWYYLRNLFSGNVLQFLIYKKIHEMIQRAMMDDNFKLYISQSPDIGSPNDIFNMLDIILSREGIVAAFEHSLIIFSYWKDESKDCQVYYDYIKKLLDKL